jgi:hypothetical protein
MFQLNAQHNSQFPEIPSELMNPRFGKLLFHVAGNELKTFKKQRPVPSSSHINIHYGVIIPLDVVF